MVEAPAHTPEHSPGARREDPRGFSEEAFFFGPARTPLYGVLHLPANRGPDKRTAPASLVHVHSFGIEQIAAYRMEVELARAAAAAGFPVLRFHQRGSGDSFGDFAAITIDGMVEDTLTAIDYLRERGLGDAPVLWGVRLGCDVALRAAAAHGAARAVVLWEPVDEPRPYFESLLRTRLISALAHGKRSGETVAGLLERLLSDGTVDVLGYPLHRRIYEEATPLALADGAKLGRDALVVSVGKRLKPAKRCAEIVRTLERHGVRCRLEEVREEPAWQFNNNPSFLCPALTEVSLAWCRERLDPRTDGATPPPGAGSAVS